MGSQSSGGAYVSSPFYILLYAHSQVSGAAAAGVAVPLASPMGMPCNAASRSSSLLVANASVSFRSFSRFQALSSSSPESASPSPSSRQLPLSNRARPVASLARLAWSSAAFLSRRSFFHLANDSGVTGVRVPVSLCLSDSRNSSRVSVLSGDLSNNAFSAARCSLVLRTNLEMY